MNYFVLLQEKIREMAIIIADSGSTKTHWAIVGDDGKVTFEETPGINPVHMSEEEIKSNHNWLSPWAPNFVSQFPILNSQLEVRFYGAGCVAPFSEKVEKALKDIYPNADIFVGSDMLGAARALFGDKEGIACILGTGSNSCLYDGRDIVKNIPPLGYVLGDEGSGAVLGKLFFNALFKGFLPEEIKEEYLREEHLSYAEIIDRVYRQPLANRFLASTSRFIASHLDCEPLRDIVKENLRAFIRRNVKQYRRDDLDVGIVGSIAYVYKSEFLEVAREEGVNISNIVKSPIELLVKRL